MADSANCLPLLAYLNTTAIEERRMVVHHQPHSLSPSHNTSTAGQPGPKISGPHCQIIFNHLQLRDGRVNRTRHNVYGSKIITGRVNRRTRPPQILLRHRISVKEHQESCGYERQSSLQQYELGVESQPEDMPGRYGTLLDPKDGVAFLFHLTSKSLHLRVSRTDAKNRPVLDRVREGLVLEISRRIVEGNEHRVVFNALDWYLERLSCVGK